MDDALRPAYQPKGFACAGARFYPDHRCILVDEGQYLSTANTLVPWLGYHAMIDYSNNNNWFSGLTGALTALISSSWMSE
jgi:hypothetical protein